jgi:hypothetical protein
MGDLARKKRRPAYKSDEFTTCEDAAGQIIGAELVLLPDRR